MIDQTADERRISPRVDYQGVVLVRNARQQIPCQALNISETGILVRPMRKLIDGSTCDGFIAFNDALKARAEST